MSDKMRILIVEDLPTDAELIEREVRQVLSNCEFLRVETRESFLWALEKYEPHMILCDFKLPQFDGFSALKLAQGQAGLLLASAMLFPGEAPRIEALREKGAEAVRLLLGSVPMTIALARPPASRIARTGFSTTTRHTTGGFVRRPRTAATRRSSRCRCSAAICALSVAGGKTGGMPMTRASGGMACSTVTRPPSAPASSSATRSARVAWGEKS